MQKFMKTAMVVLLGKTVQLEEKCRRLYAFAHLRAAVGSLHPSVSVLGRADVHGSGNIHFGRNITLYRNVHLETWGEGRIELEDHVLLNRGVHVVSMAQITIGEGTMIGEYTSIRDGNHSRTAGDSLRDSGHTAKPIVIGRDVWIGRGVAILAGVTIGGGATVGANAVVTKDVPAGATVAGVPARPIQ